MAFTTQESLLRRVQAGESVGWDEFYGAYRPLICLRGGDFGLSPVECDDLVQAVMLNLFTSEALGRFDPRRGRFRDYFRRIVDRRAVDLLRRRQPPAEAPPEAESSDFAEQVGNWEKAWQKHVAAQALVEARQHFDQRTIAAFLAVVEAHRAPTEVAEELGLSVDSVYAAKHRVLRRLRELIAEIEG